jgi:hypothetical protein
MKFKVKVNEYSITEGSNGEIKLKLSADADNGLSFDSSGNLIATPGSSGTGIFNLPGNGIGPKDSMDPMTTAGMNSTVSRHKKYTGNSAFIHNNDGVVMTKLTNGAIDTDCLAHWMIQTQTGGGQ